MATPNELLAAISGVGADRRRGGYSRHVFDDAERELRDWFAEQAEARDPWVTTDRNANICAWWGEPGDHAVMTGSHLDSVPGGDALRAQPGRHQPCPGGARGTRRLRFTRSALARVLEHPAG